MPLHSTDAIVIGGHDLSEADRIVVFYTQTAGKVRAVAEGARRIRSRFGGSLQLFACGRLVYFERPNRGLHKINEFAVLRSHQSLCEDLDRIALGSAAVEAVALGVEEEESFPDLYRLLGEGLDLLEEAEKPGLILQGFLLRLLRLLGYSPELGECVGCRRPVAAHAELFLSPAQGGLTCAACRPRTPDAVPVSAETLGFLRGASQSPLRLLVRTVVREPVLTEVSQIVQLFLRQALGRPLRSAEFLGRL